VIDYAQILLISKQAYYVTNLKPVSFVLHIHITNYKNITSFGYTLINNVFGIYCQAKYLISVFPNMLVNNAQ